MSKKVVALIPARLDSTRLPRKQLRLMNGTDMIAYLTDRMNAVPEVDDVVIATSDREIDTPLEEWADNRDIGCYRGAFEDVLGRLTRAAEEWDADIVVRANGDNPLLAPEATSAGITAMQERDYEYVTGKHMFTGLPIGMGPGIIRPTTLENLDAMADGSYQREHVTPYIFENLRRFDWSPIPVETKWISRGMSLTVDTEDDFNFVERVINSLPDTEPREWNIDDIIHATKNTINND